jgi:hypothetical protein
MTDFEKELAALINKYSLENESNTPDFILAAFLVESLRVLGTTMRQRDGWFGDCHVAPRNVETLP